MIFARPYRESDSGPLKEMHKRMGFDYQQPDWGKMLVSCIVEVDGEPKMAAFLRQTAETYLLLDPTVSRRLQLGRLMILHREMVEPAHRAGLTDVHLWMPPEIEPKFGKLLLHLGWEKPLWRSYSRKVVPSG